MSRSSRTSVSVSFYRATTSEIQPAQEVSEFVPDQLRVPQREPSVNGVPVAPPCAFARYVGSVGEIGDDFVGGALSDADR